MSLIGSMKYSWGITLLCLGTVCQNDLDEVNIQKIIEILLRDGICTIQRQHK